jgi:hypothetical protein
MPRKWRIVNTLVNQHEARALLAEQVGNLTLERVHLSGKITFKANGKIAISLGNRRLHD